MLAPDRPRDGAGLWEVAYRGAHWSKHGPTHGAGKGATMIGQPAGNVSQASAEGELFARLVEVVSRWPCPRCGQTGLQCGCYDDTADPSEIGQPMVNGEGIDMDRTVVLG